MTNHPFNSRELRAFEEATAQILADSATPEHLQTVGAGVLKDPAYLHILREQLETNRLLSLLFQERSPQAAPARRSVPWLRLAAGLAILLVSLSGFALVLPKISAAKKAAPVLAPAASAWPTAEKHASVPALSPAPAILAAPATSTLSSPSATPAPQTNVTATAVATNEEIETPNKQENTAMKTLTTNPLTRVAVATTVLATTVAATATTINWIGPDGGDLANAANWSSGTLPGATDSAAITNRVPLTLGLSAPLTNGTFYVGPANRVLSFNADLTFSNALVFAEPTQPVGGLTVALTNGTIRGELDSNKSASYMSDYLSYLNLASTYGGTNTLIVSGTNASIQDLVLLLNYYGDYGQNSLIISNGARVLETSIQTAFNSQGHSQVFVTGAGTVFSNSFQFVWANNGGTPRVVSRNGAALVLGNGATDSANSLSILDGADFTAGSMIIGSSPSSDNRLLVSNATCRILGRGNPRNFYVGYNANNNTAVITGPQAVFSTGTDYGFAGYGTGCNNTLAFLNGAQAMGFICVGNGGDSYENELVVDGEGTVLKNTQTSIYGSGNTCRFSNGAKVSLYAAGLFIGQRGYNATVSGTGNTVWVDRATVVNGGGPASGCSIGDFNAQNALILTNQASFTASFCKLGMAVGGNANSLILDNSQLTVSAFTNGVVGSNNVVLVSGTNSTLTINNTGSFRNASKLTFEIAANTATNATMLAVYTRASSLIIDDDTVITVAAEEWARNHKNATVTLALFSNEPVWDFNTLAKKALLPDGGKLIYANKKLTFKSASGGSIFRLE